MRNEKLALDGGAPVRNEALPDPYLGVSLMGKEELGLLTEVVEQQTPFRAYGPGRPHMVDDFEAEAREYFGVKYALATATGSGALYCAMAGIGVGPGDEVIVPSFAWYTDYQAPVMLGATPAFADIDRSLNLDPCDFERKITPRTKAVVVVHFQGAAADLDRILEIARTRGVLVVEDCAQACGTEYKGRKVGSIGDVACLSFQQNKIITTGDGGLLLCNNPQIFERAVRFHDLGNVRPTFQKQLEDGLQELPFSGCQFRMNELTGAVALAQLRKIDSHILDVTRKQFKELRERVTAECPGVALRQVADVDGDAGIAFYVDLGTPERGAWFKRALAAEGIRPGPSSACKNLLHDPIVTEKRMAHPLLPPFGPGWPGAHLNYHRGMCPNTDSIVSSLVCVALSPRYKSSDVDDVAAALIKVWHAMPEAVPA